MATQNPRPWSSAPQCSHIGFSISSRIPTISRFTITLPKLVLVCGTIAARSLPWRLRWLRLALVLDLSQYLINSFHRDCVTALPELVMHWDPIVGKEEGK